jgi:hypothetical protein
MAAAEMSGCKKCSPLSLSPYSSFHEHPLANADLFQISIVLPIASMLPIEGTGTSVRRRFVGSYRALRHALIVSGRSFFPNIQDVIQIIGRAFETIKHGSLSTPVRRRIASIVRRASVTGAIMQKIGHSDQPLWNIPRHGSVPRPVWRI